MEVFSRARASPFATIAVAAVLFGITVPVLKVLVSSMAPAVLVAVLASGSGTGALFWLGVRDLHVPVPADVSPAREFRWLAGTAVIGGIFAPLIQVTSLTVTPAAAASILLNFEIVSTVLIAFLLFREPVDRWTGTALAAILAGSILLSWNGGADLEFSTGAAGIILSCFLWGVDNNIMGRIRGFSPAMIVLAKAVCGCGAALVLAALLREPFPGWFPVACAFATGFVAFGAGLILFVSALRKMGAARAGAVYAAAPFVGCIVSLFFFADTLAIQFWAALPLFGAGALMIFLEQWKNGEPPAT
ncbi:MAG TPA: DMT family transporter [Methanoregula sp.]|nr:DMT family transporter [Methanoregula sp.]